MAPPLVIWDPVMLGYDLGGSHPLHPLRWELTWDLAGQLGVLDGVERFAPQPATDAELATVHSPRYIEAVKAASGPPGTAGHRFGHGLGNDDNPVFEHMHATAALIAGGSIAGARAIARGEVARAVNIAGGLHHAMADHASGFCVYNDAALAVRALLDAGVAKVAYVDVDVHHGDGVQAAFYDDPRVLTVSIHESPLSLWPGTGWPAEMGRGAAAGTAVNIPVPAGTGDAAWLRAFHAVVPGIVRAFRPDVLVTQQGADSHADDPLADLNLSVDGQRASYRALRDLAETAAGGRWLALGGGGYSVVRVVPRAWTHLLATVADRDVDPVTPLPPAWLEHAAAARPGLHLPTTMSDDRPVDYEPWDADDGAPVDKAIAEVRSRVFPLHGLDPFDPRD
ncbi:acetoin utilization protein AcuC [Nakamurella panacisegetis]|uniref:Acetoin utilization protein AcuC n=1 Tax=Nakamurella panacisegetis TaxID=1090615 RepID=A0A1H0QCV7_9ACTN|nr:acetoin utilization protein AcuC [Nakamurella panacisegetis]SDP15030.1 acetoin utilization protein AcuC [Nakamurella panacisegetis]